MDPLQQALQIIDQCEAVISALLEMVNSKPEKEEKKDLAKTAEIISAKTGLPFDQSYDMIKQAEKSGVTAEAIEKIASTSLKVSKSEGFQFGKPSEETEYTMTKTAREKFDYEMSQIDI